MRYIYYSGKWNASPYRLVAHSDLEANDDIAPINLDGGSSLVDELKKKVISGETLVSSSATGKKAPNASKSKSGSEVDKDEAT